MTRLTDHVTKQLSTVQAIRQIEVSHVTKRAGHMLLLNLKAPVQLGTVCYEEGPGPCSPGLKSSLSSLSSRLATSCTARLIAVNASYLALLASLLLLM